MKKIAFISLLFICFSSVLFAQTPTGYRIAEKEISAKFPGISKKNKESYKVNISRQFAGKKEERLLNIAEAVYPTGDEKKKNCSDQAENSSPADWSCGSFDGVLIPYAVTKGAVIYYLQVTDKFRRNAQTGVKMKTSALNYSAEIKFQPDFELNEKKFKDVYVVSMRLSWYQFCGDLCAMSFGKDRTVVLDKNGRILFVDGDGKPPVMVS